MNKIFLLGMILLLTACGSGTSLQIFSQPVQIDVARAADPEAVRMLPVQFRVVTGDTVDSFLAEIRTAQSGATPVFIAITTKDYENMSLNLADLRRYIEQQQAVIVYYRSVVEPLRNTGS